MKTIQDRYRLFKILSSSSFVWDFRYTKTLLDSLNLLQIRFRIFQALTDFFENLLSLIKILIDSVCPFRTFLIDSLGRYQISLIDLRSFQTPLVGFWPLLDLNLFETSSRLRVFCDLPLFFLSFLPFYFSADETGSQTVSKLISTTFRLTENLSASFAILPARWLLLRSLLRDESKLQYLRQTER